MFKDLNQRQRGGRSRKGARNPLAVRDPKARVYAMLLVLLMLIAGMLGLKSYSTNPENRGGTNDGAPSVEVKKRDDGVIGVPVLDRSILEKIEDGTKNDRMWWQNDVISHLLLESRGTPAVQDFNYNLVPLTPENIPVIAKDSEPWRGRYVRFRGELEYLREEPYEELYGASEVEIGLVYRGRIKLEGSEHRVTFVAPIGPSWADPNELSAAPRTSPIVDGWVRGRGIFVKNFHDEIGDEAPSVLVVATKIDRDYATVPVKTLADVPFDDIVDDPADADTPYGRAIMSKEFPRALYRLVKYAEPRAGEAGAALREKEGLKPKLFPVGKEFEELVGNAKAHRAEYLGGLGIIAVEGIHYTAASIAPNDAGITECITGWIQTDRQKLIQFLAPAPLGHRPWKKRTRIRFAGFYYKTKLYHSLGGVDRLAPMMVLTVLEEVVLPPPDHTGSLVVAGLFLLGLMVLVFVVMREDKTKESYRAMRRKRRAPIS